VLRRIALMMASNPAAEDVNLVLFSLANVSRQLVGGSPLPPPRSFSEQLPFGLRNSAGFYAREMHKGVHGHQPTSQFMGMAGSYPDSVHDLLCYGDPPSDSSSTGDNYLEEVSAPPRLCFMAGAPSDPPPEVVPSQQTHTPPDHRAQVLGQTSHICQLSSFVFVLSNQNLIWAINSISCQFQRASLLCFPILPIKSSSGPT
jgi:hypothetical protein